MKSHFVLLIACFAVISCSSPTGDSDLVRPALEVKDYKPLPSDLVVSRAEYKDKLYGFWLGQCIANWTGLVTEMDKIGNIGDTKTGDFYTGDDWGEPDKPSIWGEGVPGDISPVIDYVFRDEGDIWGADDDTDIEYMYQYLLYKEKTAILSPEQIRDGWIKHIKNEEENYLWVSNQRAFDLMKEGILPPETSDPLLNENYEMIDAQLTTEVFGLFAPGRPSFALEMAYLPVRTTARMEAANIAEFYIVMHSLAAVADNSYNLQDQVFQIATEARNYLPDNEYPALMFDYVMDKYKEGISWEQARDSVYIRYQVEQKDGYHITSDSLYCNGCFAAGINFAAGMISLLYGEGDIAETIKIGALTGWDSDNPTATWGGLLGFMIGKEGIEDAFGRKFSGRFNIHRTRQNFPDKGIDNFNNMAETGIHITDWVVQEELEGGIDTIRNVWYMPGQ